MHSQRDKNVRYLAKYKQRKFDQHTIFDHHTSEQTYRIKDPIRQNTKLRPELDPMAPQFVIHLVHNKGLDLKG